MPYYEIDGEHNAIQIRTEDDKAWISTLDPAVPCDYETSIFTAAQIEELIESLFDVHTHLQAAENAARAAKNWNYRDLAKEAASNG